MEYAILESVEADDDRWIVGLVGKPTDEWINVRAICDTQRSRKKKTRIWIGHNGERWADGHQRDPWLEGKPELMAKLEAMVKAYKSGSPLRLVKG